MDALRNEFEKPHFRVGGELVIQQRGFKENYERAIGRFNRASGVINAAICSRTSLNRRPNYAHVAASLGRTELQFSLKPDRVAALRDSGGLLPLHYAAYAGELDMCRFLIDQMGGPQEALKKTSGQGYTALHSAARGGHLRLVEMFLSGGASNEDERCALTLTPATQRGYTVLDCAIAADAPDVVLRLMRDVAPLSLVAKNRETLWTEKVLDRALQLDAIAVVRCAIEHLAELENAPSLADIKTSLRQRICRREVLCWPFGDVATYLELGGHWEVLPEGPMCNVKQTTSYVRLLSDRGSTGKLENIRRVLQAKDTDGKTILHLLLERRQNSNLNNFLALCALREQCVLMYGADASSVDRHGISAVHLIATRRSFWCPSQATNKVLDFLHNAKYSGGDEEERPWKRKVHPTPTPFQLAIVKGKYAVSLEVMLHGARSSTEILEALTQPFWYRGEVGTPMEWAVRDSHHGMATALKSLLHQIGVPLDAGSNPGDEWLVPGSRSKEHTRSSRLPHPVATRNRRLVSSGFGFTALNLEAVKLVEQGCSAHTMGLSYQSGMSGLFMNSLLAVLQRDASHAFLEVAVV